MLESAKTRKNILLFKRKNILLFKRKDILLCKRICLGRTAPVLPCGLIRCVCGLNKFGTHKTTAVHMPGQGPWI
jgi:hypothetical protein